MTFLLVQAMAALVQRRLLRRDVVRIVPAGDDGVHIVFAGAPDGLRLATRPGRGAFYTTPDAPPRVRGGRSAWPDLAGAADTRLRDDQLSGVAIAPAPPLIGLDFASGARLELWMLRGGGTLRLTIPGQPPWTLPRERSAAIPGAPGAAVDLAALAAALAESGRPDLADRLLGQDGPAFVAVPAGSAGVTLDEPPPGAPCARFPGLGAALAHWHAAALAAEAIAVRRAALVRTLRREAERAARAAAAVARDVERAPDPAVLRRTGDALLAAGPALTLVDGAFVVPDPYAPGSALTIAVDPPGARVAEVAGRLFARARKEERGSVVRAARRTEMTARAAALHALAEQAAAAADEAPLERLEQAARAAGIGAGLVAGAGSRPAAGLAAARGTPRTAAGEEAGPARVVRSPGGFEVLVGRSAAQNDRLTFHVAGPDDLWLHAKGYAGAHVILRTGGRRSVPEPDVLFAAGLAGAASQAADGERVDVHVTARKHVRKRRGAAPGSVTVQKGRVVRVLVRRRP